MKNSTIVFIMILSTISLTSSQPHIVALFTPHSHTYNNTTIPYRLFVPQNYDSTQVYPLVLTLHGSGQRGSDNLSQIISFRLATAWADPINQANFPCFVVSPQCPQERSWVYSWTGPIGAELATVVDIIDSLQTVFSIDSNRLYVTGLSMGGFGTFDLIQRYPDKFAAAIPMSGGGDPSQIANIAEVPIWTFHGKVDEVVLVQLSRDMMAALENEGKRVIYTHCKYENCAGLPDSAITMYINSHEIHFYTEYENGGHVIWDESYDYPHLFPWVFSKYRMIPNAIHFSNLNNFRVLSSIENITWNAINSDGSVQIWFSPDYGDSWLSLSDSAANSGAYSWNTELYDDCALGLLRILLRNNDGFIYGSAVSSPFTINNSTNGSPFVKILNDEFDRGLTFTDDTLQLELLIADPEQSNLLTTVYYSLDDGQTFDVIATSMIPSDTVSQLINLEVNTLANSNNAIIRVEVNDGLLSDSDQTFHFIKQSPRYSTFPATKIAGNGDGLVEVHVVDPTQLTGDLYHLSFDDTSFSFKVYNVFNVTTANYVVQNAIELDGKTEGPYFDGLRLLVKDYDPPAVNFQQTGWQNSASTLEPSIYLPQINLGPTTLFGVPYPADYRITISDLTVDTSSTAFGAPAVPMKFSIHNVTENRPAETIYLDNDNNNLFSLADDLYLLEHDSIGDPYLTWAIYVDGAPNPVLPQAGDQFFIKTFKPITSSDLYEFSGVASHLMSVLQKPEIFEVFNNYPNPFNPITTISWRLTRGSHVKLSVYNTLGQRVVTLVSDFQHPGNHQLKWDASDMASGIYFYRLEAGPSVVTKKMILLK